MTPPLAEFPARHHYGVMEKVRAVLAEITERAPGSIRELARASGLDHSEIVRARDGTRGITPVRVRALVSALRLWSAQCAELADRLEAALEADTAEREEDRE